MSNFLNILKRVWKGVERGRWVLERVTFRMQDVDARELDVGIGCGWAICRTSRHYCDFPSKDNSQTSSSSLKNSHSLLFPPQNRNPNPHFLPEIASYSTTPRARPPTTNKKAVSPYIPSHRRSLFPTHTRLIHVTQPRHSLSFGLQHLRLDGKSAETPCVRELDRRGPRVVYFGFRSADVGGDRLVAG
jgi:hypothetical protein